MIGVLTSVVNASPRQLGEDSILGFSSRQHSLSGGVVTISWAARNSVSKA